VFSVDETRKDDAGLKSSILNNRGY